MSLQFETYHQTDPIKLFSMAALLNSEIRVNTNANNPFGFPAIALPSFYTLIFYQLY